jgi:hypothetical protein
VISEGIFHPLLVVGGETSGEWVTGGTVIVGVVLFIGVVLFAGMSFLLKVELEERNRVESSLEKFSATSAASALNDTFEVKFEDLSLSEPLLALEVNDMLLFLTVSLLRMAADVALSPNDELRLANFENDGVREIIGDRGDFGELGMSIAWKPLGILLEFVLESRELSLLFFGIAEGVRL